MNLDAAVRQFFFLSGPCWANMLNMPTFASAAGLQQMAIKNLRPTTNPPQIRVVEFGRNSRVGVAAGERACSWFAASYPDGHIE